MEHIVIYKLPDNWEDYTGWIQRKRDLNILKMRIIEKKTNNEIGEKFGISGKRVGQIVSRVIDDLYFHSRYSRPSKEYHISE